MERSHLFLWQGGWGSVWCCCSGVVELWCVGLVWSHVMSCQTPFWNIWTKELDSRQQQQQQQQQRSNNSNEATARCFSVAGWQAKRLRSLVYFSACFQLVDSSSLHRGLSAIRLSWLGSHRHAGLVIHGGFWKTHAREACAAQLGDLLEWITLTTSTNSNRIQ